MWTYERTNMPRLIGSLPTRQRLAFSCHNTDFPEMYKLTFHTHCYTQWQHAWTEYVRLQIHTSGQFSYETNRVRLAGVVPLLQSCCAHSTLICRGLSAPCIGRRDRLVNSGLSGLSGRPTTLGREQSSHQSQGSFLFCCDLTGRAEGCIHKSRSKISACKIRTTGLLHVAYL